MILGRAILGLCAWGTALLPAALLAQGGAPPSNTSAMGRSVLAQPASTPVIASSEDEELPPPVRQPAGPPRQTQVVAPDSFWLDPVVVSSDGVPAKPDVIIPPGFVEYNVLRHVAGAELLLLHPFSEPRQRVVLTDLVTDQSFGGSTEPGGDLGIRLWWGMEYGWLGYRVRYTHFGNDQIEAIPMVPRLFPDHSSRAFHSSYLLELDTLDFEMTQRFCWHDHLLLATFGGRYARLERHASVVGYGTLGEGVELFGMATGANKTEGAGLTFSLNGIAPIGWHGCWHWYWGLRGSYLWADESAFARTHASAVVKPPIGAAAADSVDQAFALRDDRKGLFLGEAQLGVQYQRILCCMAADFFFRAGLEYQHWNTGDVRAASESFAALAGQTPVFGALVESSAFAHDGDLHLFGLTIAAGLTF